MSINILQLQPIRNAHIEGSKNLDALIYCLMMGAKPETLQDLLGDLPVTHLVLFGYSVTDIVDALSKAQRLRFTRTGLVKLKDGDPFYEDIERTKLNGLQQLDELKIRIEDICPKVVE